MSKLDFKDTRAVVLALEKRFGKKASGAIWYSDRGLRYGASPADDADARDLLAGRLLRGLFAVADDGIMASAPELRRYKGGYRISMFIEGARRHFVRGAGHDPFAALAALALDLPAGTKLFAERTT